MIARQDTFTTTPDAWAKLSAPFPAEVISWRQDGRAIAREGKYFARFVCYIEANTVRERLDQVVPGEWDLTLELLPQLPNEEDGGVLCGFKARLQIQGVIREDVGTGRDYKMAATDAFKRAAVRFGIGHELYAYEQNWVELDGDDKSAKPVEDPQSAYERRYGKQTASVTPRWSAAELGSPASVSLEMSENDEIHCPKCGGRMWDNRSTKRNAKAPDYRCRNRGCDGVIWPSHTASTTAETDSTDAAA